LILFQDDFYADARLDLASLLVRLHFLFIGASRLIAHSLVLQITYREKVPFVFPSYSMGFFHPLLLNLAMQPNGNASRTMSIMAVNVKGRLRAVCNTRLTVENVSSRNMPFNQKPTCQPLVLYRMFMMKMFKTPIING
jgi:hypothetical protein